MRKWQDLAVRTWPKVTGIQAAGGFTPGKTTTHSEARRAAYVKGGRKWDPKDL